MFRKNDRALWPAPDTNKTITVIRVHVRTLTDINTRRGSNKTLSSNSDLTLRLDEKFSIDGRLDCRNKN